MKRLSTVILILLVMATSSLFAQGHKLHGGQCPAHKAEEMGSSLFGTLHEIMAPAWHEAWPDSNYEALAEAVNKFEIYLDDVKNFKFQFKTEEREVKFDAGRQQFIELVAKGKAAIETGNNKSLHAIFMDLHTAFEEMAYYTLPLEYPHYNSFRIVVNLMLNQHVQNNDMFALTTSRNALMIKMDMLKKSDIPEDLGSVSTDVQGFIDDFERICNDIVQACDKRDFEAISEKLEILDQTCMAFEERFI